LGIVDLKLEPRLRGFEAAEIDSDTVVGSDQRADVNSLKFIKRGPVFLTCGFLGA